MVENARNINVNYWTYQYPGFGYRAGGAEVQLHHLLRALSTRNPNIHKKLFIRSAPDDGQSFSGQLDGDPNTEFISMDSTLGLAWAFYNSIHETDIFHMATSGFLESPRAMALYELITGSRPIICRISGMSMIQNLERFSGKPAKWLLDRISIFISQSDEMSRELQNGPIDCAKIRQVDNVFDSERYVPETCNDKRSTLRQNLVPNIKDGALIFTSHGVLHRPQKKIRELICAWVDSKLGHQGHHLILAGPIRDGGESVEDMVTQYNGKDNIQFLLPLSRESVLPFLQASDVNVLPSCDEGFSNSLLEAGACGNVLVAGRGVSGNAQITADGNHGILFDQSEFLLPQALATAVDKATTEGYRQSGAEYIHQHFGLSHTAEVYAKIYQELLH